MSDRDVCDSHPATATCPLSTSDDTGFPRPQADGLPLPWVIEINDDGTPNWTGLDMHRVWHCQAEWRCQVCGEPLDDTACVALDPDGSINSNTALHHHCVRLTTAVCPRLKPGAPDPKPWREVSRTDIYVDTAALGEEEGRPLSQITPYLDFDRAEVPEWWIPAARC